MLHRIFTEDINRSNIIAIVSKQFDAFTILEGQGFWQGTPEPCLVIEIDADDSQYDKVEAIARAIKYANKQQAVLVQTVRAESRLI